MQESRELLNKRSPDAPMNSRSRAQAEEGSVPIQGDDRSGANTLLRPSDVWLAIIQAKRTVVAYRGVFALAIHTEVKRSKFDPGIRLGARIPDRTGAPFTENFQHLPARACNYESLGTELLKFAVR